MIRLRDDVNGVVEYIGVVLAGLIAIIVGILIFYQMNSAVFSAAGVPARIAASSAASNATRAKLLTVWNSSNASAATVWQLFPVVVVIIIAGIILGIVLGFGRQQT